MSLKDQREKNHFTLQELSKRSGVHWVKISQIEHGIIKAENMILKNALRLSEALHCHPRDLLDKWPLDEKPAETHSKDA
ncbi:MAG: helix-turn-helix transcriptional regulator [Clostridia bacterium]|nr:helix-turn-helix transcriptional regulator [Clostridia bacterium]